METEPRVSVVVPIYNSAATIGACIESILGQTFTDLQLVLVDDGCTDGSGRICDDYAASDSRVVVVHQQNRGRSEARWIGVEQADGYWLAFVDSDDTLPPYAIEQLHSMTDYATDIVLGNGQLLPPPQRTLLLNGEFRHMAVRAEGTIGVPWGSLYRREFLQHYFFDVPRDFYMGEDYIFWLRMAFATQQPVRVCCRNVYNKGAEHTSNSFVWTAAYAQRVDDLRRAAVPQHLHDEYAADMLHDSIDNLFSVAVCSKRSEWSHSSFYDSVMADARRLSMPLSVRQRAFLALPSLRLRRLVARLLMS